MTPLAIAHKKLKGDLGNSYDYRMGDKFLYLCSDADYITLVGKRECQEPTYISTVEEFNNFKGDNMTDKTYTQEMADEGVLPSVGMQVELVIFENLTSCGHIEYKNEIGFLFRHKENNLCDFVEFSGDVALKPLTPPIKLDDGNAYQFDVRERKDLIAIYFEGTERFMRGAGYFNLKDCTNIQLLTVGNKS